MVGGRLAIAQPLADGVKLFSNELLIPSNATLFIYLATPILALIFALSP